MYFEDLPRQFDALMRYVGDDAVLPQKSANPFLDHHAISNHTVTISDIDPLFSKAVRCAYQMDICLLGMSLEDGTHEHASVRPRPAPPPPRGGVKRSDR